MTEDAHRGHMQCISSDHKLKHGSEGEKAEAQKMFADWLAAEPKQVLAATTACMATSHPSHNVA